MTKYFICLLFFLLFGCDDGIYHDYSEYGIASATIDSVEYSGSAFIYPKQTGDFISKSIVLSFTDSIKIEIVSLKFEVGKFYFSTTQSISFKLTYNEELFYIAKEGVLSIEHVSYGHIIGEFDVVVYDASYSCSDCLEAKIQANGKFNAWNL